MRLRVPGPKVASLLLAFLFLLVVTAHAAVPPTASPDVLLAQLEHTSGNEHARFLTILHRLENQRGHLTEDQLQQLLYWQAWEVQTVGDYARSIRMFKQLVENASQPTLATSAKTMLIKLYLINQQYVKAFTLANALIANLDKITDIKVRDQVLYQANQILIWQKQYDLALKFAKQLKAGATSDKSHCRADFAVTNTLLQKGGVLTSTSPQFQQTVDQCLTAGMLSTANTMRLNWDSLMIDEGHYQQALAFLDRTRPEIMKTGFHAHINSLHILMAMAYLGEGNNNLARKWAQATLTAMPPDSVNWKAQAAYKILYQVEEHDGQYAAALASYKKYIAQYRKEMSDTKAQALAYQIVQQEVLAKRLKLAELSKQNRILQLRQTLDRKTSETNRLYITLLLLALASIVFWAWRIKHSQLRFRKMSRHDDLTGIFNRQHFFEQAERTLHRLQKAGDQACLIILDMDHFKRINDAYGHVAGDTVLKFVVQTCHEQLRDSDLFGRLGGEEFGILMPGCNIAQGTEIGERVRRSLARSPVQVIDAESVTVTSSIGLAGTETHGYALKPLLMAADHALYEAKRGGRNRLVTRTEPAGAMPS